MTDRVASALENLNDPALYVRVPKVAIFDEHTDVVWVKGGEQVPPRTPGAKKVTHRFDRARLERMAAHSNRRTALGDFCPLAIGHTDSDEPDERRQPEIVGYAANHRVDYDRRRGKWMLYADYLIARPKFAKAREFPRSSVELWPDESGQNDVLDPISLLRRTPARDLGQWHYNLAGRLVLRYSLETSPMTGSMDTPALDDLTPDEAEQFERHCASHPLYAKYHTHKAKKYALGEEPVPAGDPTDYPSADEPQAFSADEELFGDEEPPLKNGAAFAGPTNAAPPMPAGAKPLQNAKSASKSQQYRKNAESIRMARVEKELAELRQYAKRANDERDEAEAQRIVGQLVHEGFELDAAHEVPEFMKLTPPLREARAEHIRRYYRQAPVSPLGRVPLAVTRTAESGEPTEAHYQRAMQYLRSRPGCGFEEALEKTKG